ncbi:MAG: AbrB family transcriptional regulator, partial [Oscillibacter sp.]|nr:AbrB family transcriptional regulator [Oscillibacter sp.]
MPELMWMIPTVASALVLGVVALKLKVPGGLLVGSLVGAAAVNLLTGQAYIIPETRIIAQVITGAFIGCGLTKDDLRRLPGVFKPYLMLLGGFLTLNLLMAAFIYHVTDLDVLTSLFCAVPGGISDTPLIAMDMGADGSMVAVMQLVRLLFGMLCIPALVMLADRILEPEQAKNRAKREKEQGETAPKPAGSKPKLVDFLPTFFLALAAGLVGRWTGMPAGTLSFALIAVIIQKLTFNTPAMPKWVRRMAQIFSGCCIGSTITRAQVLQLRQLIVPAIVLCLGYLVYCVGWGMVLSKLF